MLLFEPAGAKQVTALWRRLAAQGIPTPSETWQPHLTLGAFEAGDQASLLKAVAAACHSAPRLRLSVDALGVFPAAGVLYAAPTPTQALLAFQAKLYEHLKPHVSFDSAYYAPERWQPHCSLTLNASVREVTRAADLLLRDWQPLSLRVKGLSLLRSPSESPSQASAEVLWRSFRAPSS